MASIIRNVVSGMEYGNEGKKKWTQCGIMIEKDGRFYIKLNHMPLFTADADGIFFSVFDQDHNEKKQRREPSASKDPQPNRNLARDTKEGGRGRDPEPDDFSDDIPF